MSETELHDRAWAHAHAVMDLVGHAFREEEQRELFAALYNASRECLESFSRQHDRMVKRICPSKN